MTVGTLIHVGPPNATEKRECGGCSACCTTHSVQAVPTGLMEPCRHLAERGCSIFDTDGLPPVCRSFECAWREGLWGEEQRPDRCGVVAEMQFTNVRHKDGRVTKTKAWILRDVWPDAHDSKAGSAVVRNVTGLSRLPVFLMTTDNERHVLSMGRL